MRILGFHIVASLTEFLVVAGIVLIILYAFLANGLRALIETVKGLFR